MLNMKRMLSILNEITEVVVKTDGAVIGIYRMYNLRYCISMEEKIFLIAFRNLFQLSMA